MSWLFFVVGILCLIVLQSMRSALSTEFPVYTSSPIRPPNPHKFGGLDLIDAKTAALSRLGFAGPAWIGSDKSSIDVNAVTAHAVYCNDSEHIVAWLGPTIDLANPEQLLTYYTTLLQDGRYAVTQVRDPYFEAVADPQTPAQTIVASDEATETGLHKEFVTSLGIAPAMSNPHDDVLRFGGEHMSGIRSRLLQRGWIRESDGVARPSLSFAARLLKTSVLRPKATATTESPAPVPRLTFLAAALERVKDRAPSQAMQWLLLVISGILFTVIGWPLFGIEFTLVLLGVIAFHEAGHWVAMRAFGYSNPHITLLPLLGGVTIGHETDPSAAKRAWVALAGPLPGIVLAWALAVVVGLNVAELADSGGWLFSTIIVLLFVNYLNVLPIPPLDGSHIVQAILPPRWLAVQALVVSFGVAMGVYVAYLLEFWPLALIAGLQLLGLKSLWRDAMLVKQLSESPMPAALDETDRTAWVFSELEKILGVPKIAAKRVALASGILAQLDTAPMGGVQRTAVSGVYAALLVVPVAALALTFLDPFSTEPSEEVAAMYEAIDVEYDALYASATELSDTALITQLSNSPATTPASEERIAKAETRLGGRLPEHLNDFFRTTDGLPDVLGIGSIENVRLADSEMLETSGLMDATFEGELYFYSHKLGDIVVPVDDSRDWWHIGSDIEMWSYVFVDPNAKSREPAVFTLGENGLSAFLTVRDLLENTWVEQRSAEFYDEQYHRMSATIAASMSDLSVAELLDEFPKPTIFEKLLTRQFWEPGPAAAGAIELAEAKIGHRLPRDYRQALEIHNGFSPIRLLPIEDIRPASQAEGFSREMALEVANAAHPGVFTNQDLAGCWAIAGTKLTESPAGDSGSISASIFWCPEMVGDNQFLNLPGDGGPQSFTDVLRQRAVIYNSF